MNLFKKIIQNIIRAFKKKVVPAPNSTSIALPPGKIDFDSIKRAQIKLKTLGFYSAKIDGVWGNKSKIAYMRFVEFYKEPTFYDLKTILEHIEQFKSQVPREVVRAPKNYDEVYEFFGDPLNPFFEKENIINVEYNLEKNRTIKIRCHKKISKIFDCVFNDVEEFNLGNLIKSYDGCYVVRNVRGRDKLSLHSWGIAIDLNFVGNELGNNNPKMPKEIISIFEKYGFFWGGNFKNRPDGMHFEYFDRS